MSEQENIYDRLAREQQSKAQRIIIWVVLPIGVGLALHWVITDGPSRKPVSILLLAVLAVAALAVEK